MSSEIVKKQLKKVNWADLSNFDPITNTYIIKKYSQPTYSIGKMYIVQVADQLVCNNNSVVATNWNNGTSPQYNYLKIYVSKILDKMIYVDSISYDTVHKKDLSLMWSGWLPVDNLIQIESL